VQGPPVDITVPQSFRDMPRWWSEGPGWLETLPGLVRGYCSRWQLTVAGEMAHGSNAAVVPVVRGGESFALRLTPPGPGVAEQVDALRFWNGRGTVRLIDADTAGGVMLLERLAIDASVRDVPVAEAMPILGRMMRRLAVPAPRHVPSTADVVAVRTAMLRAEWERRGRPVPEPALHEALAAGTRLSRTESQRAVNGDLHSAQVLRGERERWLTVDPVLMRGDIAFDLGRVLWTRIDEMSDAKEIIRCFEAVVGAAGLDRDHGRDWVLFRTVDYWLWGLAVGLTEDPERCRRLMLAFVPG
jgi:streptomycin 6-kinase